MSNWDAMSIQLVWFTSEAHQKNASSLFELMVGQEADTVQTSKAPTINNPFLSVAAGIVDSAQVRATVQVGRLDFHVDPFVEIDKPIPFLLPQTGDLILKLIDRAKNAEGLISTVNRLALVVQLAAPVESYAQGFSVVNAQAGKPAPFSDGSDISFQVNRRKSFDGGAFVLNRLLRFQVAAFQRIEANIGLAPSDSSDAFAPMTYIDVNSVPTTVSINAEQQGRIWSAIGHEVLHIREVASVDALS